MGRLFFNFFNDATTNAMSAIIGGASLIKKVYVPKYVFVMSRVCSSLINLMSSCAALFLIMIGMRAELHWTMLLSVVPLFFAGGSGSGDWTDSGDDCGEIQGCSALVFGADGSADVSDTGYLSNVDSAGMVIPSGNDKPSDQYSDHVPECCDLWQTSRSGDVSGDSKEKLYCVLEWDAVFFISIRMVLSLICRSKDGEKVIVKVEDVSIKFSLASEKFDGFKEYFIQRVKKKDYLSGFLGTAGRVV